jgi:hypothetical protein
MARSKGHQGIFGFRPGVTWGTAAACGAGHGVRVSALMTPGNQTFGDDPTLTGRITRRPSLKHHRIVDVTLKGVLSYEGWGPLIAHLMGTAGAPTTVDTSGKQHVFVLKDDLDGIFGVIAYELTKDSKVVEVPSVKWHRLVLRGDQSKPEIEIELQGIGFDYVEDSATNTTTTIDTITYPANADTNVALFSQGTWLRNNQTTGAGNLASSPLYMAGWEITIERAIERRVTTRHGFKTDEPIATGFASVKGVWKFSLHEDGTGGSAALTALQLAGTEQKAKLTLLGSSLAGAATVYFSHVLWFPRIRLLEGKPNVDGPGSPTWDQPWESFHAASTPGDFTSGYTGAVTWEEYSQRSGDALAA